MLMINKSLADIDASPIRSSDIIDDKKETEDEDVVSIEEDDFRIMHANVCINTLLGINNNNRVEGKLVTSIPDHHRDKIVSSMRKSSNATNEIPFIDYRMVISGMKKNNVVPIQFVDRNDASKPKWCQKDKIIIDISSDNDSNQTKTGNAVIEIEDDMKKLNVGSISCITIDDDIWNDIRSSVMPNQDAPSIDITDHQDYSDHDNYDIVTNRPWTEINTVSLSIHDTQKENALSLQCEWMKLFHVFQSKKDLSRNVSKEEMKDALSHLIRRYDKQLSFRKSIFSIRTIPKHYRNSIRALVQLHHDQKRIRSNHDDPCLACNEAIERGLMKQAIISCAIIIVNFNSIKYTPPAHSDKYLKSNLHYMNLSSYS